MTPSKPESEQYVRKLDGTESRPFVSKLFVTLERNKTLTTTFAKPQVPHLCRIWDTMGFYGIQCHKSRHMSLNTLNSHPVSPVDMFQFQYRIQAVKLWLTMTLIFGGNYRHVREPISRVLSPWKWVTIIHLGRALRRVSCNQPGQRWRDPQCCPYLVLLRMGFTLQPLLPDARCALTAPFQLFSYDLRANHLSSFLSVALSLNSHWPGVTRHPVRAGARTFLEPCK